MNFKTKSELLVPVLRINVISNFGCRSLCMAFLPPFSGVFRLSLSGSWPGIPCRRLFDFQGSMKACRKHITIKQAFLGRIRSGFEGENRTWEVRFLWTALDRAYHKIARFFRKWYFRFLPSKPEVIVPVLCNIEWINDDFSETIFSTRNLLIQRPLRCGTSTFLCWISGLGKAQQAFLKSDLKNLIQNLWVGTNSPCLLRLQTRKFLCRKITAHFKLNLKTDGLICKMIFKFGEHVERFHSIRKQCVCLYKHHLRCKILVGNTQTRELHLLDAGCAMASLKVDRRFLMIWRKGRGVLL